jgi:hypothetical protein
MWCEIQVGGQLDAVWSEWFGGLAITPSQPEGDTLITGTLADQAALHGLLTRVRDLGLPLRGLRVVEPPAADRDDGSPIVALDERP